MVANRNSVVIRPKPTDSEVEHTDVKAGQEPERHCSRIRSRVKTRREPPRLRQGKPPRPISSKSSASRRIAGASCARIKNDQAQPDDDECRHLRYRPRAQAVRRFPAAEGQLSASTAAQMAMTNNVRPTSPLRNISIHDGSPLGTGVAKTPAVLAGVSASFLQREPMPLSALLLLERLFGDGLNLLVGRRPISWRNASPRTKVGAKARLSISLT